MHINDAIIKRNEAQKPELGAGAFQRLFGANDENIRQLENLLNVRINLRNDSIVIDSNNNGAVSSAESIIQVLYKLAMNGERIEPSLVSYAVKLEKSGEIDRLQEVFQENIATTFKGRSIRCRTLGQYEYVCAVKQNILTFSVGPAGTGKTYLAIALAVNALKEKKIERIILTRPAVEAGEKLGFLPGDLSQKVDPYLRPLFDALFDMLGADTCQRMQERGIIEVAPLAYMRGRTLSDAFIILDEAQNTTREQMKMFLTRIGFRSKVIVTGDPSQIDLPKGKISGLDEATSVLKDVKGIAIQQLTSHDVVRHELVQRIVEAYEKHSQPKRRETTPNGEFEESC